MRESGWWVDNVRHVLHHGSLLFPCDRNIEALMAWQGNVLLLSSDTDCLSLWDSDGLVRLTRTGVYPQDLAIWEDTAVVCGGADCCLHLLTLPELHICEEIPLPGMPERIALQDGTAYILALVPEPEVHTLLICTDLPAGKPQSLLTLPGIPGAIAAEAGGLWIGVSGQVLHIPSGGQQADMVIDGIELPERLDICPDGVIVTDALREHALWIRRPDKRKKGAPTLW